MAFTLAEVLITLSIIGVVAALTIPSLIVKNQEKKSVTRVKKAYSTLSNSFLMAQAQYGPLEDLLANASSKKEQEDLILNYLSPFLNLTSRAVYPTQTTHGGYHTTLSKINAIKADPGTIINFLSDGSLFYLSIWNCIQTPNSDQVVRGNGAYKAVCASIYIDTNSGQKPNIGGIDFFEFYLTKTGIYPGGAPDDLKYGGEKVSVNCNPKTGNGFTCTAWPILRDNIDYTKRAVSWEE